MLRLIALLLLIAGILCVGIGLVALKAAPMQGATWLVAGFVIGGAAYWLDRGRARAATERQQASIRAAESASRFEANMRVLQQLLVFGFLLLMSFCGIWAGMDSGNHLLVLGCIVMAALFGYVGWHVLRLAAQPGPTFALDLRGLSHAQYGTMPWQDIVGVSLRQVHVKGSTISTLIVGVRQPHRFVRGLPLVGRWRYRNWKSNAPAVGDIEIPLNTLDCDPHAAVAAAQAMLKRHNPDAPPFWYPGMPAHDIEAFTQMEHLNRQLAAASTLPESQQKATLTAITAQMDQLHPNMRQAAQHLQDVARKQRNQSRWVLIASVMFFILWVWLKFFR